MEQKSMKRDECLDTTAKKRCAEDLGDAAEENATSRAASPRQSNKSPAIDVEETPGIPDIEKHDIELLSLDAAIVSSHKDLVDFCQNWAKENDGKLPKGILVTSQKLDPDYYRA
ncbi:hypothetical protein PG996_013515 [Apiospora saccharicola]|uniref:Uncharacterized protein n=1 Tax=Apiospora saccharicola TaxID=335842 RepID=A0ABR1U8F0_9PEZI